MGSVDPAKWKDKPESSVADVIQQVGRFIPISIEKTT